MIPMDTPYATVLGMIIQRLDSQGDITSPSAAIHQLPELCYRAAGGRDPWVSTIGTIWRLLYWAIDLLDKVEDTDPLTASWSAWDTGPIINLTTGVLFQALSLLDGLKPTEVSSEIRHLISQDIHETILRMCAGQHTDLLRRTPTMNECWHIIEAKSAPFFALGCRMATRLATSDTECIRRCGIFGHHLGILVQLHNDRDGVRTPGDPLSDLRNGLCWTLPVAYAMSVLSPGDQKYLHACVQVADTDRSAEIEVHRLVVETGALLYLAVESQRYACRARTALREVVHDSGACNRLFELVDSYTL